MNRNNPTSLITDTYIDAFVKCNQSMRKRRVSLKIEVTMENEFLFVSCIYVIRIIELFKNNCNYSNKNSLKGLYDIHLK